MEAQALYVLDGHACLLGGGRLRPTGALGGQACLLGGDDPRPGEHSAAKPALDGQDALYVASHSSRVGSSNRKLASDSRKAVVMHSKADQGVGVVSEILPLQCGNKAVRIMTAIEQGRPSAPNRANSCSAASVCTD